jgi:hypothetical protein
MFSYPEDFELADRMSRLAREELRHFELVQQQLTALQVPFRRLSPSRYAEGLRKALRRTEHERRMDLLLLGALIEARSHERFIGLIPLLGEPLGPFYARWRQPRPVTPDSTCAWQAAGRRCGSDCSSWQRSRRSLPWRRTPVQVPFGHAGGRG